MLTTSNTNYSLSGLSPGTAYDIWVRDYCSSTDQSFWVGPVSVTTACVNTMSGVYTLNQGAASSATNFVSFGSLATTLNLCGVSGPVTVNVAPGSGPYTEKFELNLMPGVNSTNSVTINGNGEAIVDSGSGGNYAIVLLNGANHVTIDSLNVMGYATSNQVGVQFMNQADSNTIRNCNIELPITATSSTLIPITFSGSATSATTGGDNGNYNLIEGNTITGGYYGICHYGSGTTSRIVGNQIIDNTIGDFYVYGVYSYYAEGTKVKDNNIHRMNRSTVSSFYPIYNFYNTENVEITGNWIHDGFTQATGSTSLMYGIYMSACDNTPGNESVVANNVVTNNDNAGTYYGIYNSSSDNWKFYHNTFAQISPSISGTGLTRGIYHTGTVTGVEYKNNLIYMDRGTTGLNFLIYTTVNTGVDFDNNALYMPQAGTGNYHYGYYSGNQTTFADWQMAGSSAFDQNSAEGDPFFNNPALGDYAPTAAYFNNIGANVLSTVPTDINGVARTTTPDPGAYEFSPPPGPDMSVSNIYSGGASCGTSTDIIVEVLNQGTDTVTSFTVNYTVNGTPGTSIPVTGVFPTGAYDSISITGIPISGTAITTVIVTLNNIAPGLDTDAANNKDTIELRAGLSGTYTLNSGNPASATNFTSFGSLQNGLMTYGICGPVVVNVTSVAGTYYDQFKLQEVPGASSVNTVTINGNGNSLDYLGSSGERATVILDGADWITIDSLNINALGTTTSEYGFGVSLTNNADHNTISNCNITVADDLTSSNYAGLTISGSTSSATSQGASGNYNTIDGNIITGGYYGLTCVGSSADSANGNVISNNVIQDYYYYGMYNYYNDHIVVDGNDVSRPNRTSNSTSYCIYNYAVTSGRSTGNRIHDPFPMNNTTTSAAYGMYMGQFNGTASEPTIVANNMLYNFNSNGTQYGFYPSTMNHTKLINNTIVMSDPSSTGTNGITRCMYIVGSMSDCEIANNIVYLDRNAGNTSTMMYFSTSPTASTNINNNSYYAPNGVQFDFAYSGGAVPTFALWQSTTSFDANSVYANPYLTNIALGDFTPQSAVLDGYGIDYSAYNTVDINGVTRGTPPDVGAIEFTGAPCTGLSQIGTTGITASSGIATWNPNPATVTIEWGPQGFKQASITGTIINVPVNDTSAVINGLGSNKCYDYYLTMNCTSSIPGAPPVMGPYTFCTYTIGGTPGATNFPTLDSAITALNGCGINAPVIFNMNGGTHNAVTIGAISGSSAANTITFNGAAGMGDSIVATSQTAAVDLDGSTYITFNDLYMENSGGSFVVWLHNGSHDLEFDNCQLIGSRTTTTFSTGVIAASSSSTSTTGYGDNTNNLTVNNCDVVGNYYGVVINGSATTARVNGITLTNNRFEDQYYYGIRTYYADSLNISNNKWLTGFRNSTSYAVYSYYANQAEILSNEIYGSYYGIRCYYHNQYSSDSTSTLIANNMCGTSNYGAYIYGMANTQIYHNSMTGGTYGIYLSGSTVLGTSSMENLDVRNNIFEHTGTSYAFYLNNTPFGSLTVDNNLYYNQSGNIAYLGAAYATLAAWQAADTALNQNSIQVLPGFVSNGDLHIVGTAPNDVGDNSVGITTDIDGDPRPASGSTVVDMGADEFTPLTADAAIVDIIAPSGCGNSATDIAVVFQNLGLNTITALSATVNVTGSITTSLSANFTGSLASLATDTIIVGNINTYNGATVNLAGSISLTGDQDASNDTMTAAGSYNYLPVEPQFHMPDTVCLNQDSATFAAVSYSGLQYGWYANSADTVPAAVGDSFKFPVAGQNTWYVGYLTNADSLDVGYAGGNSCGGGNMFDVSATSSLAVTGFAVSTTTAASSAMNVTVHYIANGTYVGNETTAANWTLHETVATVSAGTGNKTMVMFNNPLIIPGGTTYAIYVEFAASYTNGNGTNQVITNPDMTVNLGVGLCGSFSGVNNPRVFNGSIFYGSAGCSNIKKAVTLVTGNDTSTASFTTTGTQPTFNFDASASTNADTYSWDFGDGSAAGSGVTTPHTYAANGTYTVVLTVTDTTGCLSTSYDTATVTVTIGLDENLLSRSLAIYPNPTQGEVSIMFTTGDSKDATIRVLDLSGKEMIKFTKTNLNGKFDGTLDISKLADGVYMLEVSDGNLTTNRRLIKN